MERKQYIIPATKIKRGVTKSVFEIGSYRHNLHTTDEMNKVNNYSIESIRPAGVMKNLNDSIAPIASQFLKTMFSSRRQTHEVNIKPYSFHN